MVLSNAQKQANYRARQRAKLGDAEFKLKAAAAQQKRRNAQLRAQPQPQHQRSAPPVSPLELKFLKKTEKEGRIQQKTAVRYLRLLRSVRVLVGGSTTDFHWLADIDEIQRKIHEKWPNHLTGWSYVVAITSVLRRFPEYAAIYSMWGEVAREGLAQYTAHRQDNLISEAQKDRIVKLEAIQAKFPEFKSDDQLGLIWALYSALPRRPSAFAGLKAGPLTSEIPTEGNWIRIRKEKKKITAQIVLNRYKTSKTYGQQVFMLPSVQAAIASRFVRAKVGARGTVGTPILPKNPQQITHLVKKMSIAVFDKAMTPTDWRISKASWVVRQPISVAKKKEHAIRLGHNLAQMQLYAKLEL